MADHASPRTQYMVDAVDDRVIRLELPDGVAHDCTLADAHQLGVDLASAQAAGVRAAARDRGLRAAGMNVIVSVTVGFESMRLADGASTVHVVMPAGMTYKQAEAIADRHVDAIRHEVGP